ncbi:MAG: aspartate-semialdehyde dehydrogenase [Fibrobacterota bacterium]
MGYKVAIAGATGAVGIEMMRILEQRDFPVDDLRLFASSRSAGKKLRFKETDITVEELKEGCFEKSQVALFSAGGARSRHYGPDAVKSGAVVIDNSSAFRMDPGTPLVIPEINPEDVKKHKGIIANPNCSTIIMLVPLAPVHKKKKIRNIIVSTYQAASGAGAAAMKELEDQSRAVLEGGTVKKESFPHQIAFNLFSHNTIIGENGYNEEEMKMVNETKKIFHDDDIAVSPTCIRVAVYRAHSESIRFETEESATPEELNAIVSAAPGITMVDNPSENVFPMPLDASGKDDVMVGRIRRDLISPNGFNMWVSGDQLRKGAALNAVQIAEIL